MTQVRSQHVTNKWDTATNWDTGANPVDTDQVYFSSGTQNIGDGLAQSAIELAELNIGPGYTGIIGDGGQMVIDATILRFSSRGGKLNVKGAFTSVYADSQAALSDGLTLDETVATLYIVGYSGGVILTAGMAITTIYMLNSPNARLTINASITGLTTIHQNSGVINCGSAFTTGNINGGSFTHTVGAITTLNLRGNANFVHKATGTIGTLYLEGRAYPLGPTPTFDGRLNPYKTATITNCTLGPGAYIYEDNGLNGYIHTNDIINLGGFIDVDTGVGINR